MLSTEALCQGHADRRGDAVRTGAPPWNVVLLDDHFFDEDEVLDYVWYEEMRKEDEGDDGSGKEGCLALFAFLLLPVAGAGVCVPQQRVIAAVTACAAYRSHSLFLAFKIGVAAQAGLVGRHDLTPFLR